MSRKDNSVQEFLSSRSERIDSEGSFTIAPEKALGKMAQFSLPGPHWWAAKVVQAAVAGGLDGEVVVRIKNERPEIDFPLNCPSFEKLQSAFLTPELPSDPVLRHLIPALWAVGIGAKSSFKLSAKTGETLDWDGNSLTFEGTDPYSGSASLSVGGAMASSDFVREIQHLCCTCPLTMKIEKQRLDSLLNCGAAQGDGYALAVGFIDTDLKPLSLPGGLFKGHNSSFSLRSTPDGEALAAKMVIGSMPARTISSLPYILYSNREWVQDGSYHVYKDKLAQSKLYWVLHGVIVDEETITDNANQCSVIAFANAEGLPQDISGVRLLAGEPRQSLTEKVRAALPKESLR
jgi:hypothetical protein